MERIGISQSNLLGAFTLGASAFLLLAGALRYGFISSPLAEAGEAQTAWREPTPSHLIYNCNSHHRCQINTEASCKRPKVG